MNKYIKKYTLLLIILIFLQGLLNSFVIIELPIIIVKSGLEVELNKVNYLTNIILFYIPYLTNIIIATLILLDLLKLKIKSIPIVLLSVFSYFAGVLFFLFLINSQIKQNDK